LLRVFDFLLLRSKIYFTADNPKLFGLTFTKASNLLLLQVKKHFLSLYRNSDGEANTIPVIRLRWGYRSPDKFAEIPETGVDDGLFGIYLFS